MPVGFSGTARTLATWHPEPKHETQTKSSTLYSVWLFLLPDSRVSDLDSDDIFFFLFFFLFFLPEGYAEGEVEATEEAEVAEEEEEAEPGEVDLGDRRLFLFGSLVELRGRFAPFAAERRTGGVVRRDEDIVFSTQESIQWCWSSSL